jgi:hypothetical protein
MGSRQPPGHGAGGDLDVFLIVTGEVVGLADINRIKEWRGPEFRFDKNPESHLARLHLRGAILWIRSLRPA